MGNCQWQPSQAAPEFLDNPQFPNIKKQQKSEQPKQQSQILRSPSGTIQHQPSQSFATPVQDFPQLPEKVKEIEAKLGPFKNMGKSIWEDNFSPVIIDKHYKLYNGIIYYGQWHKGGINGYGTYYLPEGSFIRGFSINNSLVDHVRFIKQNGNYYEGGIANNKAKGYGVLFQDGVLYQGNFENNFMEGEGSEKSSEYFFEGNYHSGTKLSGKLTWNLEKSEPSVYEGGFFDEEFNGQGRLVNEIGEYKGTFENGKKKGKGIFVWKSGDKFEGYYDSDLKNGKGKMYDSSGKIVLEGTWAYDRFKN